MAMKQKRQTSYGQCTFQVLSGGVPIYSSDVTAFATNPNFTTQTFAPASSTNATLQYLVTCLPGITSFPVLNIGNVTLNYATTTYLPATLSDSKSWMRSSQIIVMNDTSQSASSATPTAGGSLTASLLLGSKTPFPAQSTVSVKLSGLSASGNFTGGSSQTLVAATSGGSANTRCKTDFLYLDHFQFSRAFQSNQPDCLCYILCRFGTRHNHSSQPVLCQTPSLYELPDLLPSMLKYRFHCVE